MYRIGYIRLSNETIAFYFKLELREIDGFLQFFEVENYFYFMSLILFLFEIFYLIMFYLCEMKILKLIFSYRNLISTRALFFYACGI